MTDWYRRWEPLLAAGDLIDGRLLVLAPHPDDEVIGCGGLIIAHGSQGKETQVVVFTDGRGGDFTGEYGDEYPAIRQAECRAATTVLGVKSVRFLEHIDGQLPTALSGGKLVGGVRDLLNEAHWGGVVFPSPYELHPDHRALGLAVLRAAGELESPPTLLACEIGSFMPANLLIDVTPHADQKDRALSCYDSQLRHHDLVGKLRGVDVARSANVDDQKVIRCEAYIQIDPARIDEFCAASQEILEITDDMTP